MDITKHNRVETFKTKAIRYWTSNDIVEFFRTNVYSNTNAKISVEDLNVYCDRVRKEKCDGNCLLACEGLLETNVRTRRMYLDRAYISKWQNGWEHSPLKIMKEHVGIISEIFLLESSYVFLLIISNCE